MSSEYTKQAKTFLRKAHARMSITYAGTVNGFPFDERDSNNHNKYIVRIDRDGKSYRFPFYDSAFNTWHGKRPTAYDVLACVEKYEPEADVWDFADEFGYDIDSRAEYRRVERIWRACTEQYKKLLRLFGEELLAELQEIQ